MDHDDITRYRLQFDVLERDSVRNLRAIELLRGEFALALNASYLMGLSGGDVTVGAIWRTVPQEGVGRYCVELTFPERNRAMSDEQAAELVRREFRRAQNASHFVRIARDDFDVVLVGREQVAQPAELRAA